MINKESFNKTVQGKPVRLYTLIGSNGMQVQVTNYGAKIVTWVVADKEGNKRDMCRVSIP